MKATVDLIREWEMSHGESFFDQNEMINTSFMLGFVLGRRNLDEFRKWFDLAESDGYFLCSIIPEYEDGEYSEKLYRNSLEIICELINESPHHLMRFTDFVEENPI